MPDAVAQVRTVLRAALASVSQNDPVAAWERRDEVRRHALDAVFLKGLGDPTGPPRVEWLDTIEPDAPFRIRKLRFEADVDYWVPALVYEPTTVPNGSGSVAVLDAGGHHDAGIAAPYRQIRCANLARRGVVVLSYEFVGMGELGADSDLEPALGGSLHFNLATHELVGIGAPALMFRIMLRALDVLTGLPHVDPHRVVMTGLSGGGWQTIVFAALDDRIAGVVPVAGYTTIAARVDCDADVGDLEQVPADLATIVDYQQLTAMLAPRPTLLVYNADDDCCFTTDRVRPAVFDPVVPVFTAIGAGESFRLHSSTAPGDHNFGPDNRRELYRFLERHFDVAGADGDCHAPGDVYPEHALRVGLRPSQITSRELARRRAVELRRVRRKERDGDAQRRRLAAVLRLPTDVAIGSLPPPGSMRHVRFGSWWLPVGVGSKSDCGIDLALADGGAAVTGSQSAGRCGVDLLGTGTMTLPAPLVAMLSCAGIRLLGLQVAHTIAVAETLAQHGDARIRLDADGVVTPVVALFAGALRPDLFTSITGHANPLASLEHLITRGVRYSEAAPLFCPDLLTAVDLDEAIGLLGDVAWSQESRGGHSVPR